jgi:hypothetical protein
MNIGSSVYLVTDHKATGGGVPAVICSLYERSARIAIEREEGTKTFDVPLLSNAKLNATRSALFATEAKSIMIARGSVATDD